MTRRSSTPVLIVGAGPAGLVTALVLARQGVRSTLVERHPGHVDPPARLGCQHALDGDLPAPRRRGRDPRAQPRRHPADVDVALARVTGAPGRAARLPNPCAGFGREPDGAHRSAPRTTSNRCCCAGSGPRPDRRPVRDRGRRAPPGRLGRRDDGRRPHDGRAVDRARGVRRRRRRRAEHRPRPARHRRDRARPGSSTTRRSCSAPNLWPLVGEPRYRPVHARRARASARRSSRRWGPTTGSCSALPGGPEEVAAVVADPELAKAAIRAAAGVPDLDVDMLASMPLEFGAQLATRWRDGLGVPRRATPPTGCRRSAAGA